jgi:hypothetical protein
MSAIISPVPTVILVFTIINISFAEYLLHTLSAHQRIYVVLRFRPMHTRINERGVVLYAVKILHITKEEICNQVQS